MRGVLLTLLLAGGVLLSQGLPAGAMGDETGSSLGAAAAAFAAPQGPPMVGKEVLDLAKGWQVR